jgi:hypothetical protein
MRKSRLMKTSAGAMSNSQSFSDAVGAIVTCPSREFVPGKIGDYFREGARAVILDDPRPADIWHRLLSPRPLVVSSHGESLFSLNDSLLDIAENHCAGDTHVGDMLRFIPGGFGHIARKIMLVPKEDGTIETLPRHLSKVSIPQDLLQSVWELMTDVLQSTFPAHSKLPPYVVTIELLRYPSSFAEVEKIAALLSDTCGAWTRFGMKMDSWKMEAVGLFDLSYLRDCTAVLSLIPGLQDVLRRLNRWMIPFSHKNVHENTRLIGSPHCDGSRILTALLSERETITTEIHTGQEWLPLPLTPDRLTIIPALEIDPHLGILPTWHRILVQDNPPSEPPPKRNITLMLTVCPRRLAANHLRNFAGN